MKLQALKDPIKPEFRGLGRAVQQRIAITAEADDIRLDRFLEYVQARAKGDRLPRPDKLDTELAKLALGNPFGRIMTRSELSKKEFAFHRARWTPTMLANPAWGGEEEPGIGAVLTTSMVRKSKYKTACMATFDVNLCLINGHTISRWYQRAMGQTTDEALMDDLARVAMTLLQRKLAESHDLVVADFPPEHTITPTPHGTWRGMIEPIFDAHKRLNLCLNIRTFV